MKLEINIIYQIVYNEDNYNDFDTDADFLVPKFKDEARGKYIPQETGLTGEYQEDENLTVELLSFDRTGNRVTDEEMKK